MANEPPTPEAIRNAASQVAFSKRLIQNNFRAVIAEVIVGHALGADWKHCSADWYGWDFVHADGARLEVKQSARRQTWAAPIKKYVPRFDVRARTGYWEDGVKWIPKAGRHADIYVFAYHPIDDDSADHGDPLQWDFYVVAVAKLPAEAQTIGLPAIAAISPSFTWSQLSSVVEQARLSHS
jgi:hypothetical protein